MNKHFQNVDTQAIINALSESDKEIVNGFIQKLESADVTKTEVFSVLEHLGDTTSYCTRLLKTLKEEEFPFPVDGEHLGICSSCSDYGVGDFCYDFSYNVSSFAFGYTKAFPIPRTASVNYWQGAQLVMRIHYINFLIKCLEVVLEK